jgi:DNA polymerase III epsilon subunit-like protein
MGVDTHNQSVLIQLSVIDYFTGEVLINSLVNPPTPVRSLNTRYSGVTRDMMSTALSSGNYLEGWVGARARLWEFIDSETVLIGHALSNDLNVLHLVHPRIVDSALAIPPLDGQQQSLKALSMEFLKKRVQTGGKDGHDCVEDAFATRELVIWVLNHPREIAERRKRSDVEAEQRRKAKALKDEKKETKRLERLEKKMARDEEREREEEVRTNGIAAAVGIADVERQATRGALEPTTTRSTGVQNLSGVFGAQHEQSRLAQERRERKEKRKAGDEEVGISDGTSSTERKAKQICLG